jgi:hypothetical protein
MSEKKMVAIWKHDCDACQLIGRFMDHDLYYCDVSGCLVARHGVDGEYMSAQVDVCTRYAKNHPLGIAYIVHKAMTSAMDR